MLIEYFPEMTPGHRERRGTRPVELRDCQQRRLLARALQIGAGRAVAHPRQLIDVDIVGERHPPAAEAQYRRAIGHGRRLEAHDMVEAPAAEQRRLDALGAVGRGHQNHALHVAEVVDLANQLAEDACVNALDVVARLGRDRIDGVEEQDAGRRPPGLLEHLAQRLLRFTQPLRVQLRSVDG